LDLVVTASTSRDEWLVACKGKPQPDSRLVQTNPCRLLMEFDAASNRACTSRWQSTHWGATIAKPIMGGTIRMLAIEGHTTDKVARQRPTHPRIAFILATFPGIQLSFIQLPIQQEGDI
jgi:hypothetical protein